MRWFHVEPTGPCPSYTPGLYTAQQIFDFVLLDGYIPVASAVEFDQIRLGTPQTMGAGTCWAGTYTTGVSQKYIQVTGVDFTAFGTWTTNINAFSGIYDGNELGITNMTCTDVPFNTIDGYEIRNIRIFGSLNKTGINTGGIVGLSGSGTINNCNYYGNVTGGSSGLQSQCGGILGTLDFNKTITITNCLYDGNVSAINNHVGGIGGRLDSGLSVTSSGNLVLGSVSGGALVGGLFGSSGNATITHTNSINITGTSFSVGGIVGSVANTSVFTNCSNSGVITGTVGVGGVVGQRSSGTVSISDSSNTGLVFSSSDQIGGIIGDCSSGTFTRCYNTAAIASTAAGVDDGGGICGRSSSGTFTECFNTGTVTISATKAGGIIGRWNGNNVLTNCYSIANMSAGSQCGGLVGAAAGATGSITNSFTVGTIAGTSFRGGVVGNIFSGTITANATYWNTTIGFATSPIGTGQTTVALQTPTSNTGIYAAWSLAIWNFGTSTEYPRLINVP